MAIARLESEANSQWGSVFFLHQEKGYQFPYYLPTGEIFNHDPVSLIRFKCLVITATTPLMTIVRSVYWLAKSIFIALSEAYRYLDGQNPSPGAWTAFNETVSDSARAWTYGALLTGYAFGGIFFPYWARLHYGRLERELNRHSDGPHRDKFYLAPCFQRLYILPQDYPQNGDLVEKKLERYLKRIDAVRSAFFSCEFFQLMMALRPAST